MFCKNCFKKISSRSNFCKYCGAPVKQKKKIKEVKETEEPPVQGPPPAPKKKKEYSFKLRAERDKEFPFNPKYIGIAITIILVIALLVVLGKSSVFQTIESMNYKDYIGVWQVRGTDDVEKSGGVRLDITSVSGDAMIITMGFYDGGAAYNGIVAKDVGATIKDGKAYYTFSNDGYGNSGNGSLTFKGRDIVWKSSLNGKDPVYYEVIKVKDGSGQGQTEPSKETTKKKKKESDDYILPDSATKYVPKKELKDLTSEELRIARNEIMARHGRIFNDPELAAYFESKKWYKGTIDPETFDKENQGDLNKYELKNIETIQSLE